MKKSFLTILMAVVLTAIPARTTLSQDVNSKGRIAFVAFYDDAPVIHKINIVTINPNGSDARLLLSVDKDNFSSMWDCNCSLQWSPDYSYLLFAMLDYWFPIRTFIMSADGRGEKRYSTNYYRFKWSPDGTYVAYLYRKDRQSNDYQNVLYLADSDGNNPQRFTDRLVSDFAWSPDGKQLAISSQGDIFVASVEGARKLRRLTTNDLSVDNIGWSPDGSAISFVYRSTLYLLDIKTQRRQKIYDTAEYVWSPDGKWILTTGTIIDMQKGSSRPISYPSSYNKYGPLKWSPNGSKLLYAKPEDNIPGRLFTWDLSVNAPMKLTTPAENDYGYGIRDGVWSPDSSQIAYLLDRQICIINVDNTGHHCIRGVDQYGEIGRLAWTP